jgi:predicted MFS family arabinose efflux permease
MIKLLNIYRGAFSNIQKNIWILSLAMFVNRAGSMVLLFTSLYMTRDLHFTIAEAGLCISFYGVGSVLGSYAGGWLTDRKNFLHIMLFSLVSSGLILLLMLVAESQWAISAIVFSYAFAADLFRPAMSKAIAAYSTPLNRTRSLSLVRLAINLGFSIGPAMGGFIAVYLGYKWLFVIDALSGFLAAFALYRLLPPANAPAQASVHQDLSDSRTSAYRDMPYLLFILLVAFYGMCFFQLFASVPQFFSKDCKYDEDTIGLLLALNGLLVVVIEMPLVAWLEKFGKIFPFIIAGVLCIPISFTILVFGDHTITAAVLYTFVITMSEIFAMPFMMNYTLSRGGIARQGQYSALYSISYGLANIAAPVVGLGIAAAYGFDSMFYLFIALSIVTAVGFAWLQKNDAKKTPSVS